MRATRSFIAAVAFVAVLLVGGAAAVLVLDRRATDRIADGITVGGVDVGGLTDDGAQRRLERELLRPLDRDLVVRHRDRSWRLTAEQAGIRANVAAMVREAQGRTEEGTPFSRAWREVTGGRVQEDLQPDITFSRRSVAALVSRVERAVYEKPKDARLTFTATSLGEVEGKGGRALRADALQRSIERAIVRPDAQRTFRARTAYVAPKVTRGDLAKRNPVVITVDRAGFKLRLWKNLRLAKTYGIAVGKAGMDTPTGLYSIQNKAVDPAWHVPNSDWAGDLAGKVIPAGAPNNPIKSRWMGIYDGVGIHGTADEGSIGSAASHGCLRMRVAEVQELYPDVPVGAPIYIA